MTKNVIEAATSNGERTLSLVLALREARVLQTHAQEEAAIDAEDILTQAEEAMAMDPIG